MKFRYRSGYRNGIGFGEVSKTPVYSEFKINTGAISFKTIVLCIALFALYFCINDFIDFYANNGNVVNREYNQSAVTVEDGEVAISMQEFEAYRALEMPSESRFFSTLESIDTMAKGLNYESSSLSFDMWLARNFPLLANWKDGTFDGEGWFSGVEKFLNLIQGLLYNICTAVFRFIYYIFYRFKFFWEISEFIWL